MTDTLITANNNYYGIRPEHHGSYFNFLVPSDVKYHLRYLHITNTNASWGAWLRFGVNRKPFDMDEQDWMVGWMRIPARETINLPIDLTMYPGEYFHSQQINDMTDSGMWVQNQTNGNSTTDGTTFTTASWGSSLLRPNLLSVTSTHASAAEEPSSVVGHSGMIWNKLQSIRSPDGTACLTQYRGYNQNGGSGTTAINFTNTMTGCLWSIEQVWDGDYFDFEDGRFCQFAAGTFSDANAGTKIDVLPTMPATGKLLTVSYPSASGFNIYNEGWNEISDTNIATPTQGMAVHWARHTGDQHGRASAAASVAQRIAGMVVMQDVNPTELQSIVLHYSGVKETI